MFDSCLVLVVEWGHHNFKKIDKGICLIDGYVMYVVCWDGQLVKFSRMIGERLSSVFGKCLCMVMGCGRYLVKPW